MRYRFNNIIFDVKIKYFLNKYSIFINVTKNNNRKYNNNAVEIV